MSDQTHDALASSNPLPYRIIQKGPTINIAVTDFESLVTHHPGDNRRARIVNGVVVNGETGRTHAVIGGEIQEIEVGSLRASARLEPDQVLLKKDFILENPRIPRGGAGARNVDVPAPVSGYVGRCNDASGLVDIHDRPGGEVIARIRHMNPIAVSEGDTVGYGQPLGTQSNRATGPVHVHMEVDTRYYRQFEHYMDDLVSGRLAVDPAARRNGIEPRAIADDGVIRIGERSPRVRDAQRHLDEQGYRDAGGQALPGDGVYRWSMQAAVIRFQQAHGLPVSGDLDAATLRLIPESRRRDVDRLDHHAPGMLPLGTGPQGAGYEEGEVRMSPRRHPLHGQAEAAVRRLEEELGRPYDATSERLAASVANLARMHGLTRIDHVVLSEQNDFVRKGENVFVVQGDLRDVAHHVAHMKTADAVNTPVEESLRQWRTLDVDSPLQQQPSASLAHTQAPSRMVLS